ncbi:transporter substrate-binding domain-containing protein [Paraglaciecola aquimarina]|uniref:Transporter substrate-binding domain-containing protein n=1 Tax=Paraglaciecola algarum TaxID=3050085 RepID=A0ABS9DBS7_9ALTE|nr:transporter substrate-binding domain-containing protein [Paraglaciecola sp. G1-23]MCF2950179.1 transporter substrate-binding domain-containing protein [Paraglaciecola sp. G1-23]
MLLNSNSVARINTAEWQPYINAKGDPLGSAAELIQLLFSQDNTEVIWQYQNFELAYNQVKKNQKLAAYPYFKTPLREAEVLFSDPIFNVTSHIYYSRQFNEDIQLADLKRFRIGKVTDYSYGTEIDKIVADAKDINSEKQALIELLNNEIDYLPMTESVMNNLLIETFPEQMLLVKPLSAVKGNASLHLIASKTAEGEALKAQLNRLICHVKELDSLQTNPLKLPNKLDVASLTAAEGYPVILGQSQIEGSPDYFTLPQGTKVLVIKWSSKIQAPSKSDRLYKNMMDLSKVVVLNGPHVGKELYIRNMYIELQ